VHLGVIQGGYKGYTGVKGGLEGVFASDTAQVELESGRVYPLERGIDKFSPGYYKRLARTLTHLKAMVAGAYTPPLFSST